MSKFLALQQVWISSANLLVLLRQFRSMAQRTLPAPQAIDNDLSYRGSRSPIRFFRAVLQQCFKSQNVIQQHFGSAFRHKPVAQRGGNHRLRFCPKPRGQPVHHKAKRISAHRLGGIGPSDKAVQAGPRWLQPARAFTKLRNATFLSSSGRGRACAKVILFPRQNSNSHPLRKSGLNKRYQAAGTLSYSICHPALFQPTHHWGP